MAGGATLWPNSQPIQVVSSDGKTDPVVCTLKWRTNLIERKFWKSENADYCIKWDVSWVFEFCRLHGGQFHLFTSYWCSLHQAGDCCRYFPSFTGIVTIGLLSLCPRITSLKFLSCSPCAVPPFELRSGGAVVPTIASLMSWFSNPKFRGINLTDILWRFLTTSARFPSKVGNSRAKAEISLEE